MSQGDLFGKKPTKKRAVKKKVTTKKKTGKKKPVGRPKLTAKEKAQKAKTGIDKHSQITKKPPTKRLKKRRSVNVKQGYFPNPKKRKPLQAVLRVRVRGKIFYFDGEQLDTVKANAKAYASLKSKAMHDTGKRIAKVFKSATIEAVEIEAKKKRSVKKKR